jgi:ribonuclease VapC
MILDSSAVLAILLGEEDAVTFAKAIEAGDECSMSAVNWLETAIRVDLAGDPIASNALDDFMRVAKVIIKEVDLEQIRLARQVYRAYGKGTGHPARLNLGDCFAYALAKLTGEPLLFKGADFAQTDILAALPQ